ncbi:hypothetical protein [Aphanothece sacrum]|uniref:Uncharacterized protein n=1 Tax=Aphanothece sacrum FPU1 TaxID=1920663 RepID=A0A401IIT4_APHSA|nr:hypothetical protein [Aphanothece sacrum]GBF81116.1 hypothetical protein AsFPU1_2528 [Aphanothece sacrum FPU1]GBF86228.1 hypothetical protein AsFPU3_3299 [Aphanothece sacrum FPU3]
MTKKIKLMADYNYYPLWDMEDPDNIDPNELPLTQETKKRLLQWSKTYDQILSLDDPSSSDFANEIEAKVFESEGIQLWKQLQQELKPEYEVFYFSEERGKLLSPILLYSSIRIN